MKFQQAVRNIQQKVDLELGGQGVPDALFLPWREITEHLTFLQRSVPILNRLRIDPQQIRRILMYNNNFHIADAGDDSTASNNAFKLTGAIRP